MIRRSELERQIAEQLPRSPWAQTAQRLMCLGGIDTLTAAGLCAEIGDFERFPPPRAADELPRRRALRALLGNAPPAGLDHEVRSSRLPGITASHPISEPLRHRQAGADPGIVALSWKTQRRLHRVWTRMERRGKRRTIIAVAAARELAGFCWAISTA